jgi:hypothetical protein
MDTGSVMELFLLWLGGFFVGVEIGIYTENKMNN